MTLLVLVWVLLFLSVLQCVFVVNSVVKLFMPFGRMVLVALVVVGGLFGLMLIANEVM